MRRTRMIVVCCMWLAAGQTAFAQNAQGFDALRHRYTGCGNALNDVLDAAGALRRFAAVTSNEDKAKIECLLHAIDTEKFDARDPQYDQLLASQAVRIVVGVYGPANYDLFATMLPRTPERARRGLIDALLEVGQPEAFDEYFLQRRARISNHETLAANPATARLFAPLIERGTCDASLCSSRLPETLRVVQSNLDIVSLELQTASDAAATDTPQSRQLRTEAKDLLAKIGRVQRGEQVIGSAR